MSQGAAGTGPGAAVAVVGHAEWAEFVRVDRVPVAGEIVHGESIGRLAAGGGAVAAVQIARLCGGCLFVTALGGDEAGEKVAPNLEDRGVEVHAARRKAPQRRAFVYVDSGGERTITTIGERHGAKGGDDLPWQRFDRLDSVYFTAGDAGALRAARRSKVLVATVRARDALSEAGVAVDVLVASANDRGERYSRGDFDPAPTWVVRTDGPLGGSLEAADGSTTRWRSLPVEGPPGDSYGAGDSFAAGLACGLGMGYDIAESISLGAFCGASAVHGTGPYGSQASAGDLPRWRGLYGIDR
jgi:ribokinase